MAKQWSEEKVLKKLGVQDFRHLTKSKVIKMASMLDKVDPEVAKKAIEQFPNFSQTAKDILNDYKESLDKALDDNADSVQSYYDACNSIISSLQKEVDKEDVSFEQKQFFFDQMLLVATMMGDKDAENKRFLVGVIVTCATLVAGVVATLAAALGSNTNVESDDKNSPDD